MVISAKTKISVIIKANEKAVDVIASINRHFLKLKNPILRDLLAPRVTVEQAAQLGNVSPDAILNKLKSIGFEIKSSEDDNETDDTISICSEIYLENSNTVSFDARELINSGKDPLQEILNILKSLGNRTLLIINSFEPIPLIELLKRKGFSYKVEKKNIDLFFIYFNKTHIDQLEKDTRKTAPIPTINWEDALVKYNKNQIDLDVREQEMPWPIVSILNALSQMNPGNALLVVHRKIPQFLLPQLTERGYSYLINGHDPKVLILIFKEK